MIWRPDPGNLVAALAEEWRRVERRDREVERRLLAAASRPWLPHYLYSRSIAFEWYFADLLQKLDEHHGCLIINDGAPGWDFTDVLWPQDKVAVMALAGWFRWSHVRLNLSALLQRFKGQDAELAQRAKGKRAIEVFMSGSRGLAGQLIIQQWDAVWYDSQDWLPHVWFELIGLNPV